MLGKSGAWLVLQKEKHKLLVNLVAKMMNDRYQVLQEIYVYFSAAQGDDLCVHEFKIGISTVCVYT